MNEFVIGKCHEVDLSEYIDALPFDEACSQAKANSIEGDKVAWVIGNEGAALLPRVIYFYGQAYVPEK